MYNFIRKSLKFLLNLIVMVFIISPLLLLLYTPLYLYRLFIIFLSKIFRRDLVQIVPKRDTLFANDDCTKNPSSTVVIPLKFEGDMDLENIQTWTRKLFADGTKRTRLSKDNKYSPLQQYYVPWGGFLFRKWDLSFHIDNHVREWSKKDKTRVDHDDLYELRRTLLLEPYKPERSPWEFILVRNFENRTLDGEENRNCNEGKPVAILIAKFHHGAVDGFSLMRMLLTCFTDVTHMPLEYKEPLSLIQNIKLFGATYALAPSSAMSQLPRVHPDNIFHPQNASLKGTRHPVDRTVPVSLVKAIAKETGTSFSAVILAALAGGIRNYITGILGKAAPDSIDLTIPLPWPGHPDQMGNHFTIAVIELPVGIPCAFKRLKDLQRQFIESKTSTVPAFNFVNGSVAGSLPLGLLSWMLKSSGSSILLSNLPGPSGKISIFGQTLRQPFYEGGYGTAPLGMGVTMFSYSGVLTISINPDEGIIGTKDLALQLLGSIANEFDILNANSIV